LFTMRLYTCCFCFNLITGTKIIGAIYLICSLLLAITYGGALVGVEVFKNFLTEECEEVDIDCNKEKEVFNIVAGIYIAKYLLYIIIASVLIHGCRKTIPNMLLPSIVLGVLCVLLEIIYKIAQAVMYGVHWENFARVVVEWLIQGYFIAVIISARTFMKEMIANPDMEMNDDVNTE